MSSNRHRHCRQSILCEKHSQRGDVCPKSCGQGQIVRRRHRQNRQRSDGHVMDQASQHNAPLRRNQHREETLFGNGIRRRRRPLENGRKIAAGVGSEIFPAVNQRHGLLPQQSFIHRDLRVDNLLLDGDGNIKVSNLGLCALPSEVNRKGLVKIECFGGRLQYTAPELLVSKDFFDGSKADLWSCGIILFVMLTGKFPFDSSHLTDFVRSISTGGFECPEWFPWELNELVSMLLEPTLRKRICLPMLQTVDWVKKELEEAEVEVIEEVDELRFTTNLVVGEIGLKIVEIVSGAGFRVWRNDWLVKMEWEDMGRGGCLGVVIKFLELKVGLVIVEMSKTLGETQEFERFCQLHETSIGEHVLDWDF